LTQWINSSLSTAQPAFTIITSFYIYLFLLKENAANSVDKPIAARSSRFGSNMRLGIISALAEEQQGLVEALQRPARRTHGLRDYWLGTCFDIDAVCVLSRIGKVAAAMTATILVEKFGVTHILFTGVAGAGDKSIRVGDIVMADTLVQHDMDASPLFPRYEVPLTGTTYFPADHQMTLQLADVAQRFLDDGFEHAVAEAERRLFGLDRPRLHRGLVASADQFVNDGTRIDALNAALPGLLAVEMEGAAVAQVCTELGIPFAVIRTISDNANEHAATDFTRFVKSVAAQYAFHIVRQFCRQASSVSGAT
jgi:adenosylhomocysteine nucleosidase